MTADTDPPLARASAAAVPEIAGDATLRLLRDGYLFGTRLFRDAGADAVRTRLLGRPALIARGAEAAHVFGTPGLFARSGALPRSVVHLLQDEGSVQSLEGGAHDARKALMLSIANDDRARLVELFEEEWQRAFDRERGTTVSLLDLSSRVLARAALRWVGADDAAGDAQLARDLRAMIDRASALGPLNWWARARRLRVEGWAADRIEGARRDTDTSTAIGRLAHHVENGSPLPTDAAVVELLNLLRPVVAVARFVAFAGHALHRHPEWTERLRGGEVTPAPWIAEEVRRFYPFFPMIAGIATDGFDLAGTRFPHGQWMLFDLYGTDHSSALWESPNSFDPQRFATASPHLVVAQGVGDPTSAHHCPGEQATTDLLASAVWLLATGPMYRVPEQDLRISLRRIPAQPQSGMLIELPA
ncbi:cytochrome P450 [Microbacterium sp.]|uniref:cytochrome P450 n=1 Tax=Microbacterium sp. TaxID=51671 RepID=UPI002811D972|nr:cytochrome P450 [Microbacterium sp.]